MYDLHVHTTASDGLLTPEGVVRLAIRCGLTGLAITDHDTMDGIPLAQAFIARQQAKIDLVPGIELNTDSGEDEVHILGYFISDTEGRMAGRLNHIKEQRRVRAERIVARLAQLKLDITMEQVQHLAGGQVIGRPHIARALCEKGWAASEQDAFDKYLDHGRPAFVRRYKFPPQEAIKLIKDAGGTSILAHPGLIKDRFRIGQLIEMGIEGLEVYYPEHSPEQVRQLIRLCQDNHLLISGGSDFHGPGPGSRGRLGAAGIDVHMLEAIRLHNLQNRG